MRCFVWPWNTDFSGEQDMWPWNTDFSVSGIVKPACLEPGTAQNQELSFENEL